MWEGYEEPKVGFDELRLDVLLSRLNSDVIRQIHEDGKLTLREHPNGKLFLANASKALFTPEKEYQLFAKGIVYDRDFNLVSLPLVKIYNKGEKAVGDALAKSLRLTEVPAKWDGTMLQIFKYEGEVIYATRGEFETDPFCGWARSIMQEKYPDFEPVEGFTYVFELIHPENRIITDYGDLRDMILLAVFDGEKYLTMSEIRKRYTNLRVVENIFEGTVEEVEPLVRAMDDTSEGVVLVFEDGEQVLHRCKVKADYYIELFRMKYLCTYNNTKAILLSNPDLRDWESFWAYNEEVNTFAEELEPFLEEYFGRFMGWSAKVDALLEQGLREAEEFRQEWLSGPGQFFESEDVGQLCKAYVMENGVNHLVLNALRGKLDWDWCAKAVEDTLEEDSE